MNSSHLLRKRRLLNDLIIGNELIKRDIRSMDSRTELHIKFINMTNRFIELIWIDYDGVIYVFKLLPSKCNVAFNTFATHPWLFRDRLTGQLMQANHSYVYVATPVTDAEVAANTDKNKGKRVDVTIHFPVRTLKMNAAFTYIESFYSGRENLYKLEIPTSLKEYIYLLLRQCKTRYGFSCAIRPLPVPLGVVL